MNRRTPFAAALIAGAALLAPTAAIADPSISITVDGAPLVDAGTGMRGQTVSIVGSGCAVGQPADPAHLGMFGGTMDPVNDPTPLHLAEIHVDEAGGFTWETVLPADHELGDFTVRWYCSPKETSALSDPDVRWVSPTYTLTVVDQPAGAVPSSMVVRQEAGGGALVVVTDPDELPYLDRMGITGDVAAQLKDDVDARAARIARIQRMYHVFFGRAADPAGLDYWTRNVGAKMSIGEAAAKMAASSEFGRGGAKLSDAEFIQHLYKTTFGRNADDAGRDFWVRQLASSRRDRAEVGLAFADSSELTSRTASLTYVIAAFQVTTGRQPSMENLQRYADQLDAGAFKVQVVEDIALTAHDAAWWNARS